MIYYDDTYIRARNIFCIEIFIPLIENLINRWSDLTFQAK